MSKKKLIRMQKGRAPKPLIEPDPQEELRQSVENLFQQLEGAEQPGAFFAVCLCDSHDKSESRVMGSRAWMPPELFERLQAAVDSTVALWAAENAAKPAPAKFTVVN